MSVRELLRANDQRFLAFARDLSAAEWSAPSLCEEWTNHEVLAHLVAGYGSRLGVVVAETYRRGWSFEAANAELARTLAAARGPGELLDDLACLTARPRGMGR
jgi:Mycothiol maleylpyruvate isomerase N-terminal domain